MYHAFNVPFSIPYSHVTKRDVPITPQEGSRHLNADVCLISSSLLEHKEHQNMLLTAIGTKQ